MNRIYNLKDFRIYLIELTIILCILSICQLSLYYNQKEATERGRQIHFLDDANNTLQNNRTQNASRNHDNELDHFDMVN